MVYVDKLKERYPNTSDNFHVLHVLNMSFLHACGVLNAVKYLQNKIWKSMYAMSGNRCVLNVD